MSPLRNLDGLATLVADALAALATRLADLLTGGEHTRQRRRAEALADLAGSNTDRINELTDELGVMVMRHADATRRADRDGRALGDVLQVLIDRGFVETVRGGGTAADCVAAALDAPVPDGSEITERLAHGVHAWTNTGGAAHLFERECREIAYVLAPIVSGWLAAARTAPTSPQPTEVTPS